MQVMHDKRPNWSLRDRVKFHRTLSYAMADAGIAAWKNKYIYNRWRPVTAFTESYPDFHKQYPQLPFDPTWLPLVPTPAFPEYGSGHASFSGAAAAVLVMFFGSNTGFKIENSGITRSFDNFFQAAFEAGES